MSTDEWTTDDDLAVDVEAARYQAEKARLSFWRSARSGLTVFGISLVGWALAYGIYELGRWIR